MKLVVLYDDNYRISGKFSFTLSISANANGYSLLYSNMVQ